MICYNEPYLRYARFANGMNLMSLATYGYMRSLIDCKAIHDGTCRHDRSHVMLYEHVLGFPNFTTTRISPQLEFHHNYSIHCVGFPPLQGRQITRNCPEVRICRRAQARTIYGDRIRWPDTHLCPSSQLACRNTLRWSIL